MPLGVIFTLLAYFESTNGQTFFDFCKKKIIKVRLVHIASWLSAGAPIIKIMQARGSSGQKHLGKLKVAWKLTDLHPSSNENGENIDEGQAKKAEQHITIHVDMCGEVRWTIKSTTKTCRLPPPPPQGNDRVETQSGYFYLANAAIILAILRLNIELRLIRLKVKTFSPTFLSRAIPIKVIIIWL